MSSPPYSAGVFDHCLYAAPLESFSGTASFPPGAGGWMPRWPPELFTAEGARSWGNGSGRAAGRERGNSFPKCLCAGVSSLSVLLHHHGYQ